MPFRLYWLNYDDDDDDDFEILVKFLSRVFELTPHTLQIIHNF